MAFSGSRYAAWAVLCGWLLLQGTGLSLAQEESDLTPRENESPFGDDTPFGEEAPLKRSENELPEPPEQEVPERMNQKLPDRAGSELPDLDRADESTRGTVHCPTPEELSEWFKPLNQINMRARPAEGRMPIDCSTQLFYSPTGQGGCAVPSRNWAISEYNWVPSNLSAQPAYWDDVPLERYGQSICPAAQPGISGAKFFLTFPIIPYKIGVDRTHDLIYTLGYYRPGSPMPAVRQTLPFEWDAVAFEALAVTGMVFILP
jgi:hypothetical protein